MDTIWAILGLLAGSYGLLLLYMFINQSRFVYLPNNPTRAVEATPADIGLNFESVQLTTGDDVKLDGWFVPRPGARCVVLFFHGNSGNISHCLDSLQQFHRLGLAAFLFDYRGYGRSQGRPSEHGIYRDAESAWRYLTEVKRFAPRHIIFLGRSLGAAIAAHLASVHPPAALVIESTFTSLPELAAKVYWYAPVHWISRFRYPVWQYLHAVTRPVLIVHSRDDELIPMEHGRRLYEAAAAPKRFLEIRGSHANGFLETGAPYLEALAAFLSEHVASYAPPAATGNGTVPDREPV